MKHAPFLRKHGYHITEEADIVSINRNINPGTRIVLFILLGAGTFALAFYDYRIALLALLLLLYPVAKFRTNVTSRFRIDSKNRRLHIEKSGLFNKVNLDLSFDNIRNIIHDQYEQMADANPFEDDVTEYIHNIYIEMDSGRQFELFHFDDRDTEKEQTILELVEELKEIFETHEPVLE